MARTSARASDPRVGATRGISLANSASSDSTRAASASADADGAAQRAAECAAAGNEAGAGSGLRADGMGEPHFTYACYSCHTHERGFLPRN